VVLQSLFDTLQHRGTTGSDTVDDVEERTIRVIPIVTTLSFVRTVKDQVRGVRVSDGQAEGDVSPDTPNVLQEIMKLDQSKTCGKAKNKVAPSRLYDIFPQTGV
jgi:hypothetical protein